ncbi:MAG TPA: transglycosylase SLT domain-containing protein [Thermoleophilaceae bacterium]|nr:transglycosylase SLT domain-containing protein [Thermoleophilaceae bacterium]
MRGERGQALVMVLIVALLIAVAGGFLFAYGQALGSRGRYQRVADLSAISAARVMRTSYPRLFQPPVLPDGVPNPMYMSKPQYLALARAAAGSAAVRNGIRLGIGDVTFPDLLSFAPAQVRVRIKRTARVRLPAFGGRRDAPFAVAAKATASIMPLAGAGALMPSLGGGSGGGGYSGPLALRQGKPMRPDTAAAFDRLATAARGDGILLSITSAFRSDSEQAKLFAEHPDPKWVAPPGKSLHRNGTELDLGPPSAYGWLARNAPRFGFVKRYAWEPWHLGYVGAAADGTAASNSEAREGSGGDGAAAPAFVPERWRDPLVRASAKWNVPVELLAAQLYAESNFNPFAVSGAGARGLAQFTPETARAYGLDDPFDGSAAIDAQAHLMHDLLAKYKTAALALAAYNAGGGAVDRFRGIPPFAETQAYVTKVLGLMSGAGALAGSFLAIRLVA